MENEDFDEFSQQEPQISLKMHILSLQKQKYHFIESLSTKTSFQVSNMQEVIYHRKCTKTSKKVSRSRFRSSFKKKSSPKSTVSIQISEQSDNNQPEIAKLQNKSVRKNFALQKKQLQGIDLNGLGIVKMKNGSVVQGNWIKGKITGEAKIIYDSGDIYFGQVVDHMRHGKGMMCYSNGDRYDGGFANGYYQGYGVLFDKFGNIQWKGIWKRGKLKLLYI